MECSWFYVAGAGRGGEEGQDKARGPTLRACGVLK
jgi:hypothetical protein